MAFLKLVKRKEQSISASHALQASPLRKKSGFLLSGVPSYCSATSGIGVSAIFSSWAVAFLIICSAILSESDSSDSGSMSTGTFSFSFPASATGTRDEVQYGQRVALTFTLWKQ